MFRNYLAAALRNLARNRLYAAINIIGLAVGFAAVLLIGLFVRSELSFERWIPDQERIFFVSATTRFQGKTFEMGTTQPIVADLLRLDFPEIEAAARYGIGSMGARRGAVESSEVVAWADPDFFAIFPLPVVAGDLQGALGRPDGAVLSEAMARKYFGRPDPIGETLELDREHVVTVKAVLADLPAETHLAPGIVMSSRAAFSIFAKTAAVPVDQQLGMHYAATYVRVAPGVTPEQLQARAPGFNEKRMRYEFQGVKAEKGVGFIPLADLHLYRSPGAPQGIALFGGFGGSRPPGNPTVLVALSGIGALILLIANINFVNLMTGRAGRRAVEIGVRKATGAARRDLLLQFVGESVVHALFAAALAFALAELALPSLSGFLGRPLAVGYDLAFLAATLAAVLLSGTCAGLYPGVVLSSLRAGSVLKSGLTTAQGSSAARSVLVAGQFAILIGLVVVTLTIERQVSFALGEGMRMDTDRTLAIRLEPANPALADRVRAVPGVTAAAGAMFLPFRGAACDVLLVRPSREKVDARLDSVDFGFFELYGLQPVAGRLFARDHGGDAVAPRDYSRNPPIVVNEEAVRRLGFASADAAIGQTVSWVRFGENFSRRTEELPSEIIGVVPDFPMDTVRDPIRATFFYVDPDSFRSLSVKLDGKQIPEALAAIDRIWKEQGGPRPINRSFVDEAFEALYQDMIRQGQLLAAFSAVAIFIAALGLFGLSAFTAERRTKEIGIRKAMGAGVLPILRLLLWQFAKPVLWANLVAWPIAFWVMDRWLHGFAYHIDLAPWMFLAAGASALAVALLTVSTHSVLVARTRPVLALRYE